jgi:ABC-type enterochelin transport system permease subunit
MTMHRIRRIAPVQAAKIAAVLYGLMGLIFVPFFLIMATLSPAASTPWAGMGMGLAVALPLLYAAFGFVGTLIAAAIYNLVAGWVGGFEFEVE